MKKWKSLPANEGKAKRICEELGIPELVGEILVSRGVDTPAKVKEFLSEELPFSDPFSYQDMKKAVERINDAVDEGQRVCVYGDYDCDGMTATVLLYDYLQSVGCNVWYYIPDRESEGYGLNKGALDYIAAQETDLIVTVDNGISAINEIDYASYLGVDVVVTDHHQPREILPDAVAVVDPHREDSEGEYRDLAGVGVAFKLVCALENDDGWGIIDQYADLICIGTVADIVPLTEENRALVRQGLSAISETGNLGLRALIESAGLSGKLMTSENIAYGIAPRLNSAARLGSAYEVIELLTTEDEDRAAQLAETLCKQNSERQLLEQQISGDVEKMFTERPELFRDRVVVLDGGGWHHGVIGIVCSKVVERTGKPCVLISRDGEEARGSARSVEGFSMIDAVSYASDCLIHYGGHPFAAGMSLESAKIDAFRRKINEFAAKNFAMMPVFTLKIDKILDPADLTVEKLSALRMLEPFGCKNEMPLFAFRKVILDGIYSIGNGKHVRLRLKKAGLTFYAVWFGVPQEEFPYRVGETVDIAASCEVGEYNGEARVSVKIRDVRPSSLSQERLFSGNLAYDGFLRGEPVAEEDIPARPDFALVYRFIREDGGFRGEPDILFGRITGANKDTAMNSCRMRLCIDVMEELGLVGSVYDGRRITVTLKTPAEKVDIERSQLLGRLHKGNI